MRSLRTLNLVPVPYLVTYRIFRAGVNAGACLVALVVPTSGVTKETGIALLLLLADLGRTGVGMTIGASVSIVLGMIIDESSPSSVLGIPTGTG